jgi:signal transduction histidine kinase
LLDDGQGIGDERPSTGKGLANMEARAAARGGSSTVSPRAHRGTVVVWHVPLADRPLA